jgi:hypothetical protein
MKISSRCIHVGDDFRYVFDLNGASWYMAHGCGQHMILPVEDLWTSKSRGAKVAILSKKLQINRKQYHALEYFFCPRSLLIPAGASLWSYIIPDSRFS